MARSLRYLATHGLGDHRGSDWNSTWRDSIQGIFDSFALGAESPELESHFYTYDPIFENVDLSFGETTRALARLVGSGFTAVLEDAWDHVTGRRAPGRQRGFDETIRWTAGYVVAWLEDEGFRNTTRADVHRLIKEIRPHLLLAHSLGTLVTYDALAHPSAYRDDDLQEALETMTLVVFGSQIGNPFVRRNLVPGRRLHVPGRLRYWLHLYNYHDRVLTTKIRVRDPRFFELNTYFDDRCHSNHHCAEGYLEHPFTRRFLWEPLARQLATTPRRGRRAAPKKQEGDEAKLFRLAELEALAKPVPRKGGRKRALIVGINRYPAPEDRLEGCVNDAFMMSSVLQECDYPPGEIRLLLDDRATTQGTLERLEWLVEDARPGDELVFYFSGHGARLPRYDADYDVEGYNEILVTHDFDWSTETGVSDEMIQEIYPQLPYGVKLIFVFDCCHSGGLHRDGGAKVRGLNPPDDIRHRALEWDRDRGLWVRREVPPLVDDFGTKAAAESAMGSRLDTYRLGVNIEQRAVSKKEYQKLDRLDRAIDEDIFPFMPIVLYACQETEYAYEYRHGVESHGAFTFALANILREKGTITFKELVVKARRDIRDLLQLDQNPDVNGPEAVIEQPVPHRDKRASSRGDRP